MDDPRENQDQNPEEEDLQTYDPIRETKGYPGPDDQE